MESTENISYPTLVRDILKSLRGNATQKQMSARMGYTYNQWHKWESGQKRLMWMELELIATTLKIDLDKIKASILSGNRPSGPSGSIFVKSIIESYAGPISPIAKKKLKIPSATLHRLKDPKKDVDTAFVLKCMDTFSSTLPFFINELLKKSPTKYYTDAINSLQKQVSLEVKYPWLSAIEACLELVEYKKLKSHSHEFIADRLGISQKQVEEGLQLLLENRTISFEKNLYSLKTKRIDLRIEDAAKFSKYWTNVCLQRYETFDGVPASRKGFSSRVTPISETGLAAINALRYKFYEDLNHILQNDEQEKSRVLIYIMHLFDDSELKQIKSLNESSKS